MKEDSNLDFNSINNLEYEPIEKQHNEYRIKVNKNINSSLDIIVKENDFYYESNFTEDDIQKKLKTNINDVYELIKQKKFEIEKDGNNLKLIFPQKGELNIKISSSSLLFNELNNKRKTKDRLQKIIIIALILIFILNIILILLFIKPIKNNNNKITNLNNKLDMIENNINELKNKLEMLDNNNTRELNNIKAILENNNISEIKNMIENNNITEIYNKLDMLENNNITEINNKLEMLENNNITEINNKLDILENNNITEINKKIDMLENKMIDFYYSTIYLTNTKTISNDNYFTTSMSIFPSGNILIANSKSFIIYDNYFNNIIQTQLAHDNLIIYADIYDENNFVTCSYDKTIKTWIKKDNEYSINKIINNAHTQHIYKVMYTSKGNLISCGDDGKIKIWELINGEYKNIKTFDNYNHVKSILILEDKNILISSGYGTKIWDLNNENTPLKSFGIATTWNTGLQRIDEDKIIVCNNEKSIIILSISKLEIIKEITINYECHSIKLIKNKGLLLVGAYIPEGINDYTKIYVYRSDNYELIQTIQNQHIWHIYGFLEINSHLIYSYSYDNNIKQWIF